MQGRDFIPMLSYPAEISDCSSLQKKPIVSVAMLAYNHSRFLTEAIEGVINQEIDFEMELVIGVDKSSDNTLEIALTYQRRYPKLIRILATDTRLGMHANSIRTLEACRGEYIALCEGDDYWTHSGKIAMQVSYLNLNRSVAGTFHDCVVIDDSTGSQKARIGERVIDREPGLTSVIRENNIGTCTMMYRNVIPINELQDWFERTVKCDFMLALLVCLRGCWHYLDVSMAVYRVHGGGIWSGELEENICLHNIKFWEMIGKSTEFSATAELCAEKRLVEIRRLSITLARKGRLLRAFMEYLRSFGSTSSLMTNNISSSRCLKEIFTKTVDMIGLNPLLVRVFGVKTQCGNRDRDNQRKSTTSIQ